MTKTCNPYGLHTITPYLIVDNVRDSISFLTELLGATSRGDAYEREDGAVKHAELQIGDSVVMMGEPLSDHPARPGNLYTYVDDCDATYEKALQMGAESVQEPEDQPHGDRYGGIKDPSGNTWWLVTHIGN